MSTESKEKVAPAVTRPPRWKGYVKTVVFMLVITLVFVSPLTAVYLLTRDTIAVSQRLFLMKAVLYAADLEVPEDPVEVARVFEERVVEHQGGEESTYFEILSPGGQADGYVIMTQGAGLWGEISAAVGLSSDLETMTGLEFVSQQETPGLGARISEEWFREQFRGKQGPFRTVPEETQAGEQEFQAVTGATITTTAVQNILNRTLENAPEIVQEGQIE